LHERASMSRYTCIACLVFFYFEFHGEVWHPCWVSSTEVSVRSFSWQSWWYRRWKIAWSTQCDCVVNTRRRWIISDLTGT
jgi:hypothetical protein